MFTNAFNQNMYSSWVPKYRLHTKGSGLLSILKRWLNLVPTNYICHLVISKWYLLVCFKIEFHSIWTGLLTHWGRVTHICVSKLTIIGSDNGSAPGRRQSIIWTNAGMLLIGPLGTNFSETFIEIYIFSFNKMHLKMSSGNCRPFCLSLNALSSTSQEIYAPYCTNNF